MKNKTSEISVLIVEDNDTMRKGIAETLSGHNYTVFQANNGTDAIELLNKQKTDLVITDYRMPGKNGIEILKYAKKVNPDTEVIIITAYGTVDVAVEAMKKGALDFISKPFSGDELLVKTEKAVSIILQKKEAAKLRDENIYLRDQDKIRFNYGEIIGESEVMQKVYRTIEKVAKNNTSVLILGESGTGKELAARAIHFNSTRKDKPFIRVNCGALAKGVLESELFGHEKGAFTGAIKQKRGRFELADQGTLFLDEIGDLPPETQVKLLRVLQEKEFERVGGERTIKIDVRIIAATNSDLMEKVKNGLFREDLYYRLNILPIVLPPLRDRKQDIPLLVRHFIKKTGAEIGRHNIQISDKAMQVLINYSWPGNVRELQNIIERALVLCETSRITVDDLFFMSDSQQKQNVFSESLNLEDNLKKLETDLIKKAMENAGGVKAKAARLLGIKESTLYYKLDKLNINRH